MNKEGRGNTIRCGRRRRLRRYRRRYDNHLDFKVALKSDSSDGRTDGRTSEHRTNVVQNRKGIGQGEFPFPLFSSPPSCICPKIRRPYRQALSYRFISRFQVARRNNLQCKQCYVKLQYAMQEVNLGPKFPSAMPALNLAAASLAAAAAGI